MDIISAKISMELLYMTVKYLPIPSIKRAFSKRYIENQFIPENAKVEFAFLANSGKIGTKNNPFNYVGFRKDYDNRSLTDLEIEYIFLRVYINEASSGYIIWQKTGRKFLAQSRQGDIQTYPVGFKFPKNSKSLIRFGVPLPPFVPFEELYIAFAGYMTLKSSLGSFDIPISDNIPIDKKQWE